MCQAATSAANAHGRSAPRAGDTSPWEVALDACAPVPGSKVLDAYKMTASKVLSLWQKQAEQESDVERLEHEIRELQVSVDAQLAERLTASEHWQPSMAA